jgi:hypothetical protein
MSNESSSSRVAIRANPSLTAAIDEVLMMTDTSGPSCSMPFAFYDRASFSVRMSQGTFPWASIESSLTLPASGSMSNGQLFRRAPWVPHTHAIACTSWRTPRASDGEGSGMKGQRHRLGVPDTTIENLKDQVRRLTGCPYPSPRLSEWLMGLSQGWTELNSEQLATR